MDQLIAIDIGASSVKAAIVRPGDWEIRQRLPTIDIHHRSFDELRSAVEKTVATALNMNPLLTTVGISTTGSASPDDVVISSGFYAGYQGIRWLDVLGRSTGGRIRVVRVLNDGRAAAYGTYLADRQARGHHLVHFVIGTGIGGGMVVDGAVFNGTHHFAGAYGHIKIDPHDERRCVCGGR